jgi:hypothetical protein
MDAPYQSPTPPTDLTPETTAEKTGSRVMMDTWIERHPRATEPTHETAPEPAPEPTPISWDKPEQITTLIKIMAGGYVEDAGGGIPVRQYIKQIASDDEIDLLVHALNTSKRKMRFSGIGVQNLNDLLNMIGGEDNWQVLRSKLEDGMKEGDIVDYLTSRGAIGEWISRQVVPRPPPSSGRLDQDGRWVVDQCDISEDFGTFAWTRIMNAYSDFYEAKVRQAGSSPSQQEMFKLYRMREIYGIIQEKALLALGDYSEQGLVQQEKPSAGEKLKKWAAEELKAMRSIAGPNPQTIFREVLPWIFNLHKDWSQDLQKEREREMDTHNALRVVSKAGNRAEFMTYPWIKVTMADGRVLYENAKRRVQTPDRPQELGIPILSKGEKSALEANIGTLYDSLEAVISLLCQEKRHLPVIDLETTQYLGEKLRWRTPRGTLSECVKVIRHRLPAEWAPFALSGEDLEGWQTEADKSPVAPQHTGGGKRKSNRKKRKSNRKKRKSNRKKRKYTKKRR